MPDTFYLRVKKDYAAAVIEDLIKMDAVESINENDIELTAAQKAALDKELESLSNNDYMKKWDDVKSRFNKP